MANRIIVALLAIGLTAASWPITAAAETFRVCQGKSLSLGRP